MSWGVAGGGVGVVGGGAEQDDLEGKGILQLIREGTIKLIQANCESDTMVEVVCSHIT